MEYLHSQKIVHRDLESSNIFLTSEKKDAENSVKIGDFGLAKSKKSFSFNAGPAPTGTLYWMAPEIINPEIINKQYPYTQHSDVYAFGIVLYEIFSGQLPYSHRKSLAPEMIIFMVGTGKMKPDLGCLNTKHAKSGAERCPATIRGFIEKCINYQPHSRPIFLVERYLYIFARTEIHPMCPFLLGHIFLVKLRTKIIQKGPFLLVVSFVNKIGKWRAHGVYGVKNQFFNGSIIKSFREKSILNILSKIESDPDLEETRTSTILDQSLKKL